MLTFAPNLSWLFPEVPFAQRAERAAQNGFTAVEFGFPSHADLEALERARQDHNLRIVLFNQDVPVWDRANRGYLADPSRRDEFRRTLEDALQIAARLGVFKIMLPAGVILEGMPAEAQRECLIENLLYAAPMASQAHVLLTIEALNPVDNPGYFLTSSRQGIDVVREVNHPHVRFQLDTYHIQMMEGNLAGTIRENSEWIGHIQFADFPGRHEPGTGAINFAELEQVIADASYQDYIGLEFIPLAEGPAALSWVPAAMR